MSDFKIEKDVPIPTRQRRGIGVQIYPSDEMEIGDSVLVNGLKIGRSGSITHFYRPKKFTARTVDGGVRFWRIS